MKKLLLLAFICVLSAGNGIFAQDSNQTTTGTNGTTFSAGKNEFLLNGKPYIIRAGELHYTRIPKAYWDHRIKMCKAMGMNTICIYLFWNIHEQTPGVFDFKGQNDVAEFVRLIQKMVCTVSFVPDHTFVPNGTWADYLGGYLKRKI